MNNLEVEAFFEISAKKIGQFSNHKCLKTAKLSRFTTVFLERPPELIFFIFGKRLRKGTLKFGRAAVVFYINFDLFVSESK